MNIETIKRTEKENYEYVDLLETAIDKAEQAISNISYCSYRKVNADIIAKIKLACSILNECVNFEIEKPLI